MPIAVATVRALWRRRLLAISASTGCES
jgi:hypothetical protein